MSTVTDRIIVYRSEWNVVLCPFMQTNENEEQSTQMGSSILLPLIAYHMNDQISVHSHDRPASWEGEEEDRAFYCSRQYFNCFPVPTNSKEQKR